MPDRPMMGMPMPGMMPPQMALMPGAPAGEVERKSKKDKKEKDGGKKEKGKDKKDKTVKEAKEKEPDMPLVRKDPRIHTTAQSALKNPAKDEAAKKLKKAK